MVPYCRGKAIIEQNGTGQQFEIEPDLLDFDSVGGSERSMGPEKLNIDDEDVRYKGFPITLMQPVTVNTTIRLPNRFPFQFLDIAGQFAFMAITVPKDWNFAKHFGCDPKAEMWSVAEFEIFMASLKRNMQDNPDQIRTAWYGYRVD